MFVADTHALIWHLSRPNRLGQAARRLFEAADHGGRQCWISAVSIAEMWLLIERKRIGVDPASVLNRLEGHPGYGVLPFDRAQALEFRSFADVRDPMDRMLLAAALASQCPLVSADERLGGHGVTIVWD